MHTVKTGNITYVDAIASAGDRCASILSRLNERRLGDAEIATDKDQWITISPSRRINLIFPQKKAHTDASKVKRNKDLSCLKLKRSDLHRIQDVLNPWQ